MLIVSNIAEKQVYKIDKSKELENTVSNINIAIMMDSSIDNY